MGRSSSTQSPFLVERPDTGKYVYQRKLPAHLRPLIVGAIAIAWKARIKEIEAPDTLKISLSTGDLDLARARRDQIHVQIEDLVARAQARLNAGNKAKLAQQVGTLVAADIRQMAGQVRHDILAADDEATIDRNWSSPLADLIFEIRGKAGAASRRDDAVIDAADVERRRAKDDLAARDVALYDKRIEEGEIEADPALVARLLAMAQIRDPRGLSLGVADIAALMRCPGEVATIPSPVDNAMADNGMAMPRSHPDRRRLALDLLRAEVAAHDIVGRRRAGDPTPTPERPATLAYPVAGQKLSQARGRWIELFSPKKKACDDNKLYLDAFIAIYGDLPVAAVTRKMIREFRDLLKKRPRNMPKAIAELPLKDQVAWGQHQEDCRLVTAQTVNAKGIGSLSAVMEAAIKEDHIEINPCKGQLLPVKGHALDRLPYDVEDLNRIFASAIYLDDMRWIGGGGEAQFWFPLIGLLAGPRLEEIGQLLPGDVRSKGNIFYFDFITIDEEAETAGTKPENKDLKTPSSRRPIPIHRFLIEIGFLRYVAKMKAAGARRLFPDLEAYEGKLTKNWSRWWGRFARKHVTKSQRKVFHSLRHAFADRVRKATKGNEDIVKAMLGHKKHMYGEALDLETRLDIIDRLDFSGVDLSQVKNAALRLNR